MVATATQGDEGDDIEFAAAVVSSAGSERATSGSGGKIVTIDGMTHVVWQDATDRGAYLNRVRSLNRMTGEWSEPVTLNTGKDNHARPVIAVDRDGYLHVILSGHNSPVTYRRSVRPNDSSEWTKAEPAGTGTYPVLTCDGDGTLLVTMRSSQRWNGVDLYVKERGKDWQKRSKLVLRNPKMTGYAGFQTGFAWGPRHQVLHMVVDFYESYDTYKARGAHQAVCYMRSLDGGLTWQKANGEPVAIPARPEQMDILGRHIGPGRNDLPPPVVLAQGSLVVDPQGLPHVLYITHQKQAGQVVIASPDSSGVWQRDTISEITEAYPKLRPVGCRGSFTASEDGTRYALLELKPLGAGWEDGKPKRSMVFAQEDKRLVWLVVGKAGRHCTVRPALPANTVFNQANVERAAGYNEIQAGHVPSFVYFDGTSRYRKKNEVLQNTVLFLSRPGRD
jgi:hypothetical protein